MKKYFVALVIFLGLFISSQVFAATLTLTWGLVDPYPSDSTVIEIKPNSEQAVWSVLANIPEAKTNWSGEIDNSVYPRESSFQLRAKVTRNGIDSQGKTVVLESPYCDPVTGFISSATPGKPSINVVITQ